MSTKPRFVILVVVDEPAGKHKTGGRIAVPIFRKIASGILALCGSQPHEGELILASTASRTSRSGFVPSKTVKVHKGRRQGEWIVPDLKGLDMRQVLDACGTMKCDPSFKGAGIAVGQKPKAGRVIKEGDPLVVSFQGQS